MNEKMKIENRLVKLNEEWFEMAKKNDLKEMQRLQEEIEKCKKKLYDLSSDKHTYKITYSTTNIFGYRVYVRYVLYPSDYGFKYRIDRLNEKLQTIKKGRCYKNKRLLYTSIDAFLSDIDNRGVILKCEVD